MSFKFISDFRGMTLVQTLMSAAIGFIIMTALSAMLYNSMKLNKAAEVRTQINDTVTLLKMHLSSDKVCREYFLPYFSTKHITTNESLPKITALKIKSPDGSNTNMLALNETLGGISGTVVQNIEINGLRDNSHAAYPFSRFVGNLEISVYKGGIGGTAVKRSFPISIRTAYEAKENKATIVGCTAMNTDISDIEMELIKAEVCSSMSGEWSNGQCQNIRNVAGYSDSGSNGSAKNEVRCKPTRISANCVDLNSGSTASHSFEIRQTGSVGQMFSALSDQKATGMFTCTSDGLWTTITCATMPY